MSNPQSSNFLCYLTEIYPSILAYAQDFSSLSVTFSMFKQNYYFFVWELYN